MSIIISVLSLVSVATCVVFAKIPYINRIEIVEFGLYTVDRAIQGRDGAGINKASAFNVRHAAAIRTAPAQIGVNFGFRYKVIGEPLNAPVDLKEIVIFPAPGLLPSMSSGPIPQAELALQPRIGETGYASYTLEDSFELVSGTWIIEIWHGTRKLAEQTFHVINPDTDCGGAMCAGL
jgi:Domain of unknown function (DUF3859)